MHKTRVVIKPDTTPGIGLGHLYRCLSIISMIKDYFDCILYDSFPTKKIEQIASTYCKYEKGKQLFGSFLEFLNEDDIVLVDDYNINAKDELAIKQLKTMLVLIDDNFFRKYHADLIINHCPGIKPNQYNAPKSKLLLGLDYAILRPAFLAPIKSSNINNDNIFICFGGDDSKNLTSQTIKTLEKVSTQLNIKVVIGPRFANKNKLNTEIEKSKHNIELLASVNELEMAKLIHSSKLCIVACSSILIEVKAMGVPCIGIKYVNNQESIFNYFNIYDKSGIYIDNDKESFSVRLFNKAIKLDKPSNELIDKESGKRILNNFFDLRNKSKLILKEALSEDALTYFKLVNDPQVRKNSFQTDHITIKRHLTWFKNKILSKNSFLFLAKLNNVPCGQIRFDIDKQSAFVDISVAKNFRGKHLSPCIIELGIKMFKEKSKKNIPIIAEIKITNQKSINSFKRNNFIETKRKKINGFDSVILIHE